MSTLSTQAITSNTQKFGYDATWSSLYDFALKPQVWGTLIKKYGPLMEMFEFLQFAGATTTVKSHTQDVQIEGSYERSITLGAEATAAAEGATFTFQLSADDYDTTTSRPYLLVDDKILIPKTYATLDGVAVTYPIWYQVQTVGVFGADCTAFPLDKDYGMSANIPISTVLMVSGGNYSPGSDGPGSKNSGWYEDTFYTAIKKSAFEIEGGVQSTERYYDNLIGGGQGMFSKASIEADLRLNSDINDEILLGHVPDNTNLTMANSNSVSSLVYGTKGILPHLEDDGMSLIYNGTFTIPDFDQIKTAFLSQGVTDTRANFFCGPTLHRYVENSGLEFLKEYSGGTDLMENYSEMGIELPAIRKNGILTVLHELKSFANPVKYGISSYDFDTLGFILPETNVNVKMGGAGAKMQNVVLGYKNYNGENRTRIVKPIPGVNGHASAPNVAVNSYDEYKVQMLSEFMLMFFKANQAILVKKA